MTSAIGAGMGQAMTNERRADDARLMEHERRLTLVEGKVETLAPKVEVMEQVHALREGQAELSNEIRSVTGTLKNLTDQVSSLANEIKTAFHRISEINETHMVNLARQADEVHEQQLAAEKQKLLEKDALIKKMEQDAEEKKLSNRIKAWSATTVAIVALIMALAFLIKFFGPVLYGLPTASG